jgi:Na+/proline symporter
MEDSRHVFANRTLKRLLLFIYLVPVFGVVPAIWTLTRQQSNSRQIIADHRQQREVSRVAILMGLVWFLGTVCLTSGVALSQTDNPQSIGLSWLLLSSLFTSGYFLTNLGLMVRVWRRQSLDIPGIRRLTKLLP